MRKALALALLLPLLCACNGTGAPAPRAPRPHAAASLANPTVDRFTYAAGTSGTYLVPTGYYVVGWWAHNTTGGGSVSVTPTGPRKYPTCASWDAGPDPYDAAADSGPDTFDAAAPSTCRATSGAVVIPAGSSFGLSIPVLAGGPDELGDGTTFVFTGTDSYVIVMEQYV